MRKEHLYLKDILSAIQAIETFVGDMEFTDFEEDDKTQSAVIQKFEVMGEATKNLSDNLKQQYPDIPWREMSGMRDRLVHGYFDIDTRLVWQTIKQELPSLHKDIQQIYKAQREEE